MINLFKTTKLPKELEYSIKNHTLTKKEIQSIRRALTMNYAALNQNKNTLKRKINSFAIALSILFLVSFVTIAIVKENVYILSILSILFIIALFIYIMIICKHVTFHNFKYTKLYLELGKLMIAYYRINVCHGELTYIPDNYQEVIGDFLYYYQIAQHKN